MDGKDYIQKTSLFDESNKGNLLFHYTSLNNAIAILGTRSLLFGSLNRLNDMNESWRPIQCAHWEDDTIDFCEKELLSYVQISLTCDDNPETNNRRGFDIATLWGHYASGGNGVSIVLNKRLFLDSVDKIPETYHDYVQYKEEYDCAITFLTSDPVMELRRRITDVFFCKSVQWKNEQEFRIIKKSFGAIDYIDISNCIEGVIFARLGTVGFESPHNTRSYWALKKISKDIPLFRYIPRDLDGNRTIISDGEEKVMWTSGERIDFESDGVIIG